MGVPFPTTHLYPSTNPTPTNKSTHKQSHTKTQPRQQAYKVGDDLRFACEIDATGVPGEPKPAKETEMAAAGAAAGAAAPAGK